MSKKPSKKYLGLSLFAFVSIGVLILLGGYQIFLRPNAKADALLYIPSGSSYKQVLDSLEKMQVLENHAYFDVAQRLLSYHQYVKPGCYSLRKRMNNRQIVRMLKAGLQTPVRFTFNNIRTLDQFLEKVDLALEMSADDLRRVILDADFLQAKHCDSASVVSLFIPNTYEIWWTTSPTAFAERMGKEYDHFWTPERLQKAAQQRLKPLEVSILASIVEEESQKSDERPLIASVYLNRLRKGMLLQADPTVKFATGDFSLRRILKNHLATDSPFNTYKYKGLPPGPICFASVKSLDAVLHAPSTDYLYFCAKADFSGYHSFAADYAAHMRNARAYWAALDRRQ